MHIGIDARMPYYQIGGISQYAIHLIKALAALDKENKYTIFHSRRDRRDYRPSQGENFRRQSLWTPCHHRLEGWALGAEIWPRRLDLLHSPDFIPPRWGARRRLITVHDLNFLYYPQFLTVESYRYYVKQIDWAVAAADGIIADSEHTRRDLIDRLQASPEKVRRIYLAANPLYKLETPAAAIAQTLARLNLPEGFILFVGTLEPRKNLPTLLAAYNRARQEAAVDTPLVLVGNKGWLTEEIFAAIESLQLSEHARHLTGVSNEELAHLYRAAGALALPSFYEGFGLTALEAMHSGCPVIASNRASLPEVVGDAGLLLEPDDSDAWAAALARVLQDTTLRAEMITAGRQQANRFNWQETAAATLQFYLDLR